MVSQFIALDFEIKLIVFIAVLIIFFAGVYLGRIRERYEGYKLYRGHLDDRECETLFKR